MIAEGDQHALTEPYPKARYVITPAPIQNLLMSRLPARWVDRLLAGLLGLRPS
jgi:hypothetical protein